MNILTFFRLNVKYIILGVCELLIITAGIVGLCIPGAEETIPTIESEPYIKEIVFEAHTEIEEESVDEDLIIAQVVMAEAGNQPMIGKVAVAMTILNRADYWDMTIEEVVSEPNQYSYPFHGIVTEECYRAVEIARNNRDLFPDTMFYFRTTNYHSFGEPYMVLGDHYFSLIEEGE